MQPVVVLDGLD